MALKDVMGQERAISILLGTLNRKRMPSSYLFAGESGIGKKFTAINLAKALNCQNSQPSARLRVATTISHQLIDCCDECPSCKKIDNQTHPDFLIISPDKGEIIVEKIRTVEETLSFAPYEGKMKVVIVDDAEEMNASAANAFLKTLEEPPPQSIIILISSSPDRLPETIRSRCSRVNFAPLSPEKCEEVIMKALKSGSAEVQKSSELSDSQTSGLLSTAARLSMGRPGLAISDDLIEERDWFIRLLKEVVVGGNKEAWADKEEIEKWFDNVFIFLRDLAVLKTTGRTDMLINIDLKDSIFRMSKTLEIKDIIESHVKISFLKGYLGFNLNKSITWNYTGVILRKFRRGI